MRKLATMAAAVLMIAVIAEAAPSKAAQDWRNGPEHFLLTSEEQKAWKAVQSDAEAAAFIDLFWARRDPTPGTPRNETREEILQRVRYADANFADKRHRGAVTERGQVFILLGPANEGQSAAMNISAGSGPGAGPGGKSGERVEWKWPREKAVAVGMPKLEVAFVQQQGSDQFFRDVRFGQFSNAIPAIIKSFIVSPDLTAAPDWAAKIGKDLLNGVAAAPVGTVTATPGIAAKATGKIGRVVLLNDLNALDLDSATDPFEKLTPVTEFAVDGDLAYVVEYCGGKEGPLKIEINIAELAAAAELSPAPMKAVAGCGAVPGMLSLSGLKAGSHELLITTIEANGGKLRTKTRLQIK